MKLPNHEQAIISTVKLTQYLLNPYHPHDPTKGKFFVAFGFSISSWQIFRDALNLHATTYDVSRTELSPYGIKYVIDGIMISPNQKRRTIRVIWIILNGEQLPRLVTAYPLEGGFE